MTPIGPEGGTVEVEGCRLVVPPLALTRPEEITITRVERTLPDGAISFSPVFHFEPEGLIFRRPARLEIDITGEAAMVRPSMLVLSAPEGEELEPIGDDVQATFVAGDVHHFSDATIAWIPPREYGLSTAIDRIALEECPTTRTWPVVFEWYDPATREARPTVLTFCGTTASLVRPRDMMVITDDFASGIFQRIVDVQLARATGTSPAFLALRGPGADGSGETIATVSLESDGTSFYSQLWVWPTGRAVTDGTLAFARFDGAPHVAFVSEDTVVAKPIGDAPAFDLWRSPTGTRWNRLASGDLDEDGTSEIAVAGPPDASGQSPFAVGSGRTFEPVVLGQAAGLIEALDAGTVDFDDDDVRTLVVAVRRSGLIAPDVDAASDLYYELTGDELLPERQDFFPIGRLAEPLGATRLGDATGLVRLDPSVPALQLTAPGGAGIDLRKPLGPLVAGTFATLFDYDRDAIPDVIAVAPNEVLLVLGNLEPRRIDPNVALSVAIIGLGDVVSLPGGIDCRLETEGGLEAGVCRATVPRSSTLVPIPTPGWHFVRWTRPPGSTLTPRRDTMGQPLDPTLTEQTWLAVFERDCVVTNAADPPDAMGRDENCDGSDGRREWSFYVSVDGDDENPGTPEEPMRTIGAAKDAAIAAGRPPEVIVGAGTYTEDIVLEGTGLLEGTAGIFGGYDPMDWSRSDGETIVDGSVTVGVTDGPVIMDGYIVNVAGPSIGNRNAYGMHVLERPDEVVILSNMTFVIGDGAPGEPGPHGADGMDATPGSDGSGPSGGTAGTGCEVGGFGGGGGTDGNPGAPGGTGGSIRGGVGGSGGGINSMICLSQGGFRANAGGTGFNGVSANTSIPTVFSGMDFVVGRGNDGTPGSSGGGGGGGGGGSGAPAVTAPLCTMPMMGPGGGGGAGGGGGCGGEAGEGGTGGGSTYGVFMTNTSVTFVNVTITVGNGGAGGEGGDGGSPGNGGAGGLGFVVPSSLTGGPASGGNGAAGAAGGYGGAGSGGPGGSSYCVIYRGVAPDITGLTCVHGRGGEGGPGGFGFTGPAAFGPDGDAGPLLAVP